ncbi:MAG: tetratricopeptide repeat protein, partial [Deltaproteobacteria bacterium]|nr:tetratricopeptide repeat protein [Deltaproteobacteria bacterium]
ETYGQELREDEKQKYFSTDPQALEKLRDLKKRILQARSATLVVRTYSDPSQLSRLILSDLEREIAQRLPSASSKGITEEGETEQEAFVRSRTRLYLPRPFLSKLLDEHVTKSKVPLLVVGEPGIGKSALLANWYEGRRKSGKGLTLAHFLGSGYGSSSYTSIMTSILIAMKEHFHLDEPLPQSPPELQQAFPLWLATAAARAPEPIVLVLDGLDGLEGPQDWTMSWFPDVLPPKVRVIASATPDAPALEHLQKRGWLRHDLKGFIWSAEGEDQKKHNEKEALTELYLDHYGRSLDKEVRDAVLASPHTANPLFLLTVLEELRVVCSYRDMGNQVKDYLAAATLTELYGKVLHRWEEDYNVDDMDLVRKTVSALWAAHRGLSREELLDLLGGIQYVSDERYGPPIYIYRPYPAGELAPMFQAMQGQMTVRADLFRFSNEAFREAVRSRYLWEDSTRRRQHLELAIYFANKRRCLERSYAVGMPTDGYWPTRVTEELPWQLAAAEEWEGLKEFLQSALGLAMVAAETEALRTNDLIRYCNLLEKQGYDVVEGFKEAVVEFDDGEPADGNTAKLLTMLGKMLERFGRYDGARYFHEQFLNIVKKSWPDQPEPQVAALLGVGMNSVYRGDFSDAGLLLNEALHICERDLGQDHFLTAITLINLTLMLVERRDGTRAVSFGRKALEFATKVFPNPHTERATAMNNLALALMQTEEYAEAEVLLMEVLDIRERLFGKVSQFTAQSHNNLGLLYWYREEYEKAEKCYKTCLQILESITGRDNPDFANGLANLADLFRDKGSFKAAKPLYIEGIDILTRSLGPNHPDTLKAKNNYEAAAEGNRGSRPFEMVAVSQEVLAEANLLAGKRDYAEARISLYEKETGLPEQEDGPYGVVRIKTLRHLGDRAHRTGLYDLAEMIFRDLLVECRAFKGLHDSYTIEVLNNLGLTLRKKGKINEAES